MSRLKRLVFCWVLLVSPLAHSAANDGLGAQEVRLGCRLWDNQDLPFVAFKGAGRFGSGIGMSLQYEPIRELRAWLEAQIGTKLLFFRGWHPEGEAHVTAITPMEFFDVLSERILIERIAAIAEAHRVQGSDLRVQGIGRGQALIDGRPEETYFLIIESENLRSFRWAVHREFVDNGGDPAAWDPDHYFPHVTIGFTKRDLHESDGIVKDVEHALDQRFVVVDGCG